MSNVIQNHLYVKGPVALVDEIVTKLIADRAIAMFRFPAEEKVVIAETEGTKTIRCSFESASDAPYEWFKGTVGRYHDQGVRYLLSWYDADNIQRNPFVPEDDVVCSRFGEFYTELIPHPHGDQPDYTTVFRSPAKGVRSTEGHITLVFNRRQSLGDAVDEVSTEYGIASSACEYLTLREAAQRSAEVSSEG